MSLCVAWKYEDARSSALYFAADSCAVAGNSVMPYGGVKVLEIPIRIDSAALNGRTEPVLHGSYGLAFTGQYFAAFVLKETISEVLSHLQFLGPPRSLSFDTICELVLRFTKHYRQQIQDHLPTHEVLEFFFGGYCNQSNRVRVAKFSINPATREPRYEEILAGQGFLYETIGNEEGQARFKRLMDLSLLAPCRAHFTAFKRLWDVIRDPNIRFVKGAVQCGEFQGNHFRLLGMFDLRVLNGQLSSPGYIRGSDVDQIHHPISVDALHISYAHLSLFNDEMGHFEGESFWESNGTGHVIDELITVVPYNPNWNQWFRSECDFLRMAGVPEGVPIEHIGSTAVQDLAAVPCVDLLVGTNLPTDVQTKPFDLSQHGYEYLGDRLIAGQRCYRKLGGRDAFKIIVTPFQGEFWNRALKLRDYLRENPQECADYTREKIRILNQGSWTLTRYRRERNRFLEDLIGRAQ